MTIMSVSASRHSSGFSIQSILGDIDKKQTSDKKEEEKKNKKSNIVDECNTCSLNQNEVEHSANLHSRLYGGHFDAFSNDNLLRKLQYAHYGHYMSQEYMSRTQEDFRHIWPTSEDSYNSLSLPLRLHNSFSPRGQGSNQDFLFSHIRKPKRVRTAFSPSQLLRLEHAFENNHYVVGQERKELAAGLGLTETQVKVWFQNRRTKHKRIRAEDEMTRSLARSLENRGTKDTSQYNTSDSESEIDI